MKTKPTRDFQQIRVGSAASAVVIQLTDEQSPFNAAYVFDNKTDLDKVIDGLMSARQRLWGSRTRV